MYYYYYRFRSCFKHSPAIITDILQGKGMGTELHPEHFKVQLTDRVIDSLIHWTQ